MTKLSIPSKKLKWAAAALALWTLAACDGAPPSAAVASTPAAPAVAAVPAPAIQPVALKDACAAAFEQLRQCHSKTAASGQASPKRLEQSATYLRRLQAWWEMDRGNPAILTSCQAIASGGLECDPSDGEEDAESDAEFKMLMEQFDKAGVPR